MVLRMRMRSQTLQQLCIVFAIEQFTRTTPPDVDCFWPCGCFTRLVFARAQIVLLGVCLAPGPGGEGVPSSSSEEVTLQPLPLYAAPSDNVTMCAVAAGPNGRIFLGGADGHLYEVVYAAGDTWRAKRCYKVGCL